MWPGFYSLWLDSPALTTINHNLSHLSSLFPQACKISSNSFSAKTVGTVLTLRELTAVTELKTFKPLSWAVEHAGEPNLPRFAVEGKIIKACSFKRFSCEFRMEMVRLFVGVRSGEEDDRRVIQGAQHSLGRRRQRPDLRRPFQVSRYKIFELNPFQI